MFGYQLEHIVLAAYLFHVVLFTRTLLDTVFNFELFSRISLYYGSLLRRCADKPTGRRHHYRMPRYV